MIKKVGSKYVLYSKSKKNGHRKRLGTFASRAAAMKRERQIQYFKHLKEMTTSGGAGAGMEFGLGKTAALVPSQKHKKKKGKAPKMANLYQEQILRDAIRRLIELSKFKYYHAQGQQYLQEQQLRMVIRKLLTEKAEPTPYNNTGLNTAAEVIQRIKRTIIDTYKSLTTSDKQRQDFIATVEDMTERAIEQQDLMKKIEAGNVGASASQPVSGEEEFDLSGLTEQDEEGGQEQPEQPAIPLANAEEAGKSDQEKSAAQAKQIATQVTSAEPDTTGGSKAIPVVSTIIPQILTARDSLKDPKDKEAFDLAIIGGNGQMGNLKAFADIAEKEIQATVTGKSTPAPSAAPAPTPEVSGAEVGTGEETAGGKTAPAGL